MKSIAAAIVVVAGAGLAAVGCLVWPRDAGGAGTILGGIICLGGMIILAREHNKP
jgi:hypothetical protein